MSAAPEFGKVAVLMGGPSSEREISFLSGNAVLRRAARQGRRRASRSIPPSATCCELKREGFERVFIALHGRFGEDGTVQGALETLGIPYTGSGVMASALAMDKWRTKLVWLASGIPTPRYRVVDARTDWMRVVAELGLPLIVKPAREGSTIGITKVTTVDHDELALAYAEAARSTTTSCWSRSSSRARELTASILGDRALPLIRIEAPQGNYDYHNKYFSDETKYFCPSGLPGGEGARDPRRVARARSASVGCSGWGRLDLILRRDGTFSFLEVNTSPGMTGHSLVPMAAQAGGHGFRRPLRRDPARRPCGMTRRQMNALAAALALRRARAARAGARSRGRCASPRSRSARSSCTAPLERASARAPRGRDPRGARRHVLHDGPRARAQRARARAVGAQASRCAASGRSRLEVTIEEHAPLARWNDAALVNAHGEVFVADYNGELPQFDGPDGTRRRGGRALSRVGARRSRRSRSRCAGIRLSPRGGWRLHGARRGGPLDDRARPRRAAARGSRASSPRTAARSARSRAPARASSTSTFAIATDSRRACPASARRPPKKAGTRRAHDAKETGDAW